MPPSNFQYRLSPHVTFAARDSFQKSSNFFNQPDLASSSAVSGGAQGPNQSVIAPLADRLSNFGNVGITYQFTANDMVGGSGTFSRLTYPNPTEVQGLYDSSSQAASGFFSHRVSRIHYLGATYQYQRLMSYPTGLSSETQTQAVLVLLHGLSHAALFFFVVRGPAILEHRCSSLLVTRLDARGRGQSELAGAFHRSGSQLPARD